MGIENLPKAKWSATGRQVILKEDFIDIEDAIVSSHASSSSPGLTWVDDTSIRVLATVDSPAGLMMTGFPNILHSGQLIAGASDSKYRENTANVTMDFDVAASLWGTEKARQWYLIYALAGDIDTTFTLKAMPWMTVKSQATQTISLGTLANPATGIGYGFTTDELSGYKLYVLTGASRGFIRTITSNNNDNTTGGTITYSGTALSLAEGNIFIILPDTNFRYLGDIYNNASLNIITITTLALPGNIATFIDTLSATPFPAIFSSYSLTGSGGGGSGSTTDYGNHGGGIIIYPCSLTPSLIQITIGAGGVYDGNPHAGTSTTFGAIYNAAGGAGGVSGANWLSSHGYGNGGAPTGAGAQGYLVVQW